MSDDVEDACDEVWHGTNGDELCSVSGCAGCHFVLGAAVAFGLMGMAIAIRDGEQHRRSLRVWAIGREEGTHCLGCLEGRAEGRVGYLCKTHREGAAMAFGLMGMAEAIRQRCTCKPCAPGETRDWSDVCERCKGYPLKGRSCTKTATRTKT